jgi:heat shock protein HtpX
MNNQIKTFILLAAIVALFMLVGGMVGGTNGMIIALVIAGGLNFLAYWHSADMILRMYDAQEVSPQQAPDLYSMVLALAKQAELPMPRVYVINQEQPNAFATGRNPQHAAVVFSTGIIKLLNYDELRGVAAHELSHIRHRDILISSISAVVAGAIAALANFALFFGAVRDEDGHSNWLAAILLAILAPIAASVIQMAISRSREYLADEAAAYLTLQPLALANALQKIEYSVNDTVMPVAKQHPATAQMMIVNPLSNSGHDNLFSTHPSTSNRIARLYAINDKL